MSTQEHKIPTSPSLKLPLRKRIGRWLRRIVTVGFITILLGSVAMYFVSQTDWFRDMVRDKVLAFANDNLAGRLEFSRIGGNVLSGLIFEDLRLLAAGDTLLYTKRLTVRYDLEPLLRQTIAVNQVLLEQPRIKLLRDSLDSTWNYEHIAKPSTDTSESAPFDWTIKLRDVELAGAELIRRDYTLPDSVLPQGDRVRFNDLDVGDMNIELAAFADFEARRHNLQLRHISFDDRQSGFALRDLSGEVTTDTSTTDVQALSIISAESELHLSARLEDINLLAGLDPGSWRTIPAAVALSADSVSTKDLQRFLPELDFLAGTVGIQLNAEGHYGDLTLHKLILTLEESRLDIGGRLKNLHRPEELFIDATINKTRLSYNDVLDHVPGLNIPDLGYLGRVQIQQASFYGKPQDFKAMIEASTAIGKVEGTADLDVSGDIMKYDASLSCSGGNLSGVLRDNQFASELNSNIILQGEGTSLDELNTRFRIESRNSRIDRWSYAYLLASGDIKDGGRISFDTLQTRWQPPQFRSDGGIPSLAAKGWLNLADLATPTYNFDVQLSDFNLDKVVPGQEMISSISSSIAFNGRGLHPDSLEVDLYANITEFAIPDKEFLPFELTALLQRRSPGNRQLAITSGIADLTLDGDYRFSSVEQAVSSLAEGIGALVEDKYQTVNTIWNDSLSMALVAGAVAPLESNEKLDASFFVRLRNLKPLALVNPRGTTLEADAQLRGSLRGTMGDYSVELEPSSSVSSFLYRTDSTYVRLRPAGFNARFYNRFNDDGYQAIGGRLQLNCDSLIEFNNLRFRNSQFRLNYDNEELQFDLASVFDETFGLRARGSFDLSGTEYVISMDSLGLQYENRFLWRNEGDVRAAITSKGMLLDSLTFVRDSAERVRFGGLISTERFSETTVSLQQFRIRDINKFTALEDRIEALEELEGDIDRLDIVLNGTWTNPVILALMKADSLVFNRKSVGNNQINLEYRDSVLTGKLVLSDPTASDVYNSLNLRIDRLPLAINLLGNEDGEQLHLIDGREVKINIEADSVPMATVGPFVPSIRDLRGFANAGFLIGGTTPDKVSYTGDARFYNTSFLVESTNMRYAAQGNARLLNNKILVDSLYVINHPEDISGSTRRRRAFIDGSVTLAGFDIKHFDLNFSTQRFMVMNRSSRATSPDLYGDLVISTGDAPLRIFGSLLAPNLKGDVEVVVGDLIFPESRSKLRSRRTFCFERLLQKDGRWVAIERDCDDAQYGDAIPRDAQEQEGPQEAAAEEQTGPRQRSFTDRIYYDLKIGIKDKLKVTMILGPLEELKTVLTLSDAAKPLQYYSQGFGDSKVELLKGDLQLVDGSSYKFYRNFEPKGTIRFNGVPNNPYLDIVANLKGRWVSNKEARIYVVTMQIKGTRDNLDVTFAYTINGTPAVGDSDQITSNALSLIVFGRTLDEFSLGGNDSSGPATRDILNNVQGTLGGKILSDVFNDFLAGSGLGVIDDIQVDLGSATDSTNALDLSKARVRFSGQIFDVGGEYRVETGLGDVSASNFSLELPLGFFIDPENLASIFLEVSFSTGVINKSDPRNKALELKLGHKIVW